MTMRDDWSPRDSSFCFVCGEIVANADRIFDSEEDGPDFRVVAVCPPRVIHTTCGDAYEQQLTRETRSEHDADREAQGPRETAGDSADSGEVR